MELALNLENIVGLSIGSKKFAIQIVDNPSPAIQTYIIRSKVNSDQVNSILLITMFHAYTSFYVYATLLFWPFKTYDITSLNPLKFNSQVGTHWVQTLVSYKEQRGGLDIASCTRDSS